MYIVELDVIDVMVIVCEENWVVGGYDVGEGGN